ncbi:survival motor neuron protein [Zerene cesonia]|uniref:survival motor neuron protein n=1 Tax=Zerene cesonia TaxID=33412 RepID=UPI0018E59277|nr:survival motor neuron protein [Zerene cesonia]
MSNSEVLYVKGMNVSESEEEEEYVWDDRKLNDAYDKAIRIANAEVAKRVAMSTNTQSNNDPTKQSTSKNKSAKPTTQKPRSSKTIWKAGMPCRAVFEEDGLEYEALILSIVNDKECIVQFLGYNNLQKVLVSTLNPSLDRQAQTLQVEKALLDRADDGFESQSPNVDDMEYSDRGSRSPGVMNTFSQNRKKSAKKKNKQKPMNKFDLPDIPMPNMSMLKNLGSMDMPLPPPPPLHLSRGDVDSEEQAVSSMLLSWYMSGYYTGLYQGMKRARESRGDK